MIEQCGVRCDVCGTFILTDKSINPFTLKGIEGTLTCHDDCKPTLQSAMRKGSWRELPDGPIRKAFETAEAAPVEKCVSDLGSSNGRTPRSGRGN